MKTIFTVLILFITLSMSAQFDITSGENTGKTIKIDNKDYPILATNSGSEYIVCNSPKSKKDYPVWVGIETSKVYEGQAVRQSKSGKYFIFVISKNSSNPYCKYLKEEI